MVAVAIVYAGLLAMFVAVVSLLWPLKFAGIRTRRRALGLLGAAVLVAGGGMNLPAIETRVDPPQSRLDLFFPAFQFHEFHSIRIAAPRKAVYESLKQVTAEEIFLFRTLVWLRRFGQSGPPSILNPPPDRPLLEVATSTSFLSLADIPNHEVVFGTLVAVPPGWHPTGNPTPESYSALANSGKPGFRFAGINFKLQDCDSSASGGPCTLLTTETRVHATDALSRRRFARYWRVIYPGSSLIRGMWLRAIRKRAEAG
jgi:hypothetical protein